MLPQCYPSRMLDPEIVFRAFIQVKGLVLEPATIACTRAAGGTATHIYCYGMSVRTGEPNVYKAPIGSVDFTVVEWGGPTDTSAAPGTAAAGATSGDGRFAVGTDIAPGLYETTVTLDDPLCLVTVYVTPTETDILADTLVSTTGTHYFEVPADAHSIEVESIDDACVWTPSS